MADSTLLPHLPDLVMHQIILRLPTKPAIRMSCLSKQWEGVWSALRILDFDERSQPHDDNDDDNNYKHVKFLNILARYLEFRQKDKQQPPLDKFRLSMRYLDADEDAIIGKLLSNSFERNVKDLDISLRSKHQEVESYYCLPRTAIINAKSVTTLNLEHLRIKDIDSV
ncbi:F-box/FBD/LRR-repeat protein [Rosa sericea]